MAKFIIIILLVLGLGLFLLYRQVNRGLTRQPVVFGASFNSEYAYYLGVNPKQVFEKIIGEWNFPYVRLSAQWNAIEKNPGQYDWHDLDWLMNTAAEKNVKVMLVLGYKTPRWPECHIPDWVMKSKVDTRGQLEKFMQAVVERYYNHPALEIWQVENEPFLKFGICEKISSEDLDREIKLVKNLDPDHQVIVTDSGELSTWRKTAKRSDLFGTTVYRIVWNKFIGYWSYDWLLPAFVYRAKLWFNNRDISTAYITELQAEPWIPDKSLMETPVAEQYKSMSLEQLQKNIEFTKRIGMPRAYLWGAEWWYWLQTKGEQAIPDFIKKLNKGR